MKLIFTILIIGFLNLAIASEDKVLNDENYINDDQYYKKGINFYENGEFKKSFVALFPKWK